MTGLTSKSKEQLRMEFEVTLQQSALSVQRARWWTEFSATEANADRVVLKGGLNGTPLTREELRLNALQTAERHQTQADKLLEHALGLISQL